MSTIDLLNKLLASTAVYYQNVKSFHWLIKGKNFFDLHAKYGELYECADEDIDALAERILMLDGIPLHTYESFSKTTMITPEKNVTRDIKGVDLTLKNLRKLITIQESVLESAEGENDQATMDMMIKMIGAYQKQVWMLDSWLS